MSKLRQTIVGNSPVRLLWKWADLNQTASAEPGRFTFYFSFDVSLAMVRGPDSYSGHMDRFEMLIGAFAIQSQPLTE